MTTGMTIASIMPVALNRICRSAKAMGPFGSSTPSVQPPSIEARIGGPQQGKRIACQTSRELSGVRALWPGTTLDGSTARHRGALRPSETGRARERAAAVVDQ